MRNPIIEISTTLPTASIISSNRNVIFAIATIATLVGGYYYSDQINEELKKTWDFFHCFYDAINHLNHISTMSPVEQIHPNPPRTPAHIETKVTSPTEKPVEASKIQPSVDTIPSPINRSLENSNQLSSNEQTTTHSTLRERSSRLFPRAYSSGDVILVDHGHISDDEKNGDEGFEIISHHANTEPDFKRHFTSHH